MKKTKTTEITVEMDELLVITKRDRSSHSHCQVCGARVQMVTLAQAVSIAHVSELVICGQIKSRFLHSIETPEGRVLICLNSLLK